MMKINIDKLKSYFGTKTVIHVDSKEKNDALVSELEKLECATDNGRKISEVDCYHKFKKKTCYSLHNVYWFTYGEIGCFKHYGYKIVPFNDLLLPESTTPDQSCKQDIGKLKLSLVPTQIIRDIAEVRKYGNNKYGESESWRRVEPQRYIDALLRHTLSFIDDPHSFDSESGIQHLKHMAANVAFLCEMFKGEV